MGGGFLWHPQAIIQSLLLFVQYFHSALSEDWPLIEAVTVFFFPLQPFFKKTFYSYLQERNASTAHQVSLTGTSV